MLQNNFNLNFNNKFFDKLRKRLIFFLTRISRNAYNFLQFFILDTLSKIKFEFVIKILYR